MHSESRIFLCEFCKTDAQLVNVSLALRLNCNTDNRIREAYSLKHNRMCLVTQRVTCTDILETNARANITGINNLHRHLLV